MSIFVSALMVAAFASGLMPFAELEAESFLLSFLFAIAGVVAVVALRPPGEWKIPKSPVLWLVLLFWALAAFSMFMAEAFYVSLIYFSFFSVFALVFIVSILVPDKDRFFKIVGFSIAGIFAALAVTGIVQYFFFPESLPPHGRVQWPLANPNSLGALYVMAFFMGLGGMLGAKNRLHSNLALVFSVLIIAAIFATGSRGSMFSLLAGFACFAALAPAHFKTHKRCVGALTVAGLLIGPGFLFLATNQHYPLSGALMDVFSSVPDAPPLRSRPEIWISAWYIMRDHFWTGTGIGTFFLYYPQYRGADYESAGFMVHNDPLQFGAEMGIFAPVLFYGLVIAGLLCTLRALKVISADSLQRVYIAAPACAFAAIIVHCHVTYHFYLLPVLALTGLLLGFWYEQVRHVVPERLWVFSFSSSNVENATKIIVLLPLLMLFYNFALLHGSHLLTARAEKRLELGDMQGFADDVNRASNLAKGKNEHAYLLAVTVPMGILETQGTLLPREEVEKLYAQADGFLNNAWALDPRLDSALYYKARLLRSVDGLTTVLTEDTPESLLQRALMLDPLHIGSRLMLADIYARRGEKEKAFEVLKDGMKWSDVVLDPLPLLQKIVDAEAVDVYTKQEALHLIAIYRSKQTRGGFSIEASPNSPTQQMLIRSLQDTLVAP